jgi:hypothetical protein
VTGAVLWAAAAAVTVWSIGQLLAVWRDRPRPVRGADGRWRAPRPPHNGWGDRRPSGAAKRKGGMIRIWRAVPEERLF